MVQSVNFDTDTPLEYIEFSTIFLVYFEDSMHIVLNYRLVYISISTDEMFSSIIFFRFWSIYFIPFTKLKMKIKGRREREQYFRPSKRGTGRIVKGLLPAMILLLVAPLLSLSALRRRINLEPSIRP